MANQKQQGTQAPLIVEPVYTGGSKPDDLQNEVADATSEAKGKFAEVKEGVTAKASEAANTAKEKLQEFGKTAEDKLNQSRQSAVGALESAASSLRRVGPSGQKVSEYAETAADKLTQSANYLRQHDVRDVASGFERSVRSNPGAALVVSAGIGFLLGAWIRSEND